MVYEIQSEGYLNGQRYPTMTALLRDYGRELEKAMVGRRGVPRSETMRSPAVIAVDVKETREEV